MTVGKVTADSVKALRSPDKDGPLEFLWDDKLAGFGVKATPGGAKVYVLQYRMGGRGHKTKRYTIGREGSPWRAASARQEAERLLILVKQGVDIAGTARDKKRVAVELAFKDYVKTFADTTLKREWPKSWKEAKRCLELHASAHLKEKPLPDVTADDIRRLLRRLDDRPATKRNLFAALSFMFNKSVKEGVIADSPLKVIDPPSPVADRDRTLNDDELRWLWKALESEAEPYRGIVEELLLTGQRRNEVAALPWSELNRDRREWHLPGSRTKNGCDNIIPLTDRMVGRLDAVADDEKWPKSGLVRSSREGTVVSGWSKLKRRLDKEMAKAAKKAGATLEPWKLHDLRRTVATNLQRLGVRHEVVEHLLNHREKARTGISKVYQTHDFKPEKLKALERWEAELDRIVSGAPALVLPFERRA